MISEVLSKVINLLRLFFISDHCSPVHGITSFNLLRSSIQAVSRFAANFDVVYLLSGNYCVFL